ncbi:hypothetical protein I6A84_36640, partial [Frankia sp. CNm7]
MELDIAAPAGELTRALVDVASGGGAGHGPSGGSGTPAAHLGITVPRFPNLFLMYGPNTNIVV